MDYRNQPRSGDNHRQPPQPPPNDARPDHRNTRPPQVPPPNLTPDLPRTFVVPSQGSPEYNLQYNNIMRRRNTAIQFRNCVNRFTYVWLWNGNAFWFYPIFVGWQTAEGFLWNRGRWEYRKIDLHNVFYHSCF